MSKPYNTYGTQPPKPAYNPYIYTTPPPIAQTTTPVSSNTQTQVKNENSTTVNLILDGQQIAESVTKSQTFSDSVSSELLPFILSGR